MAETQEADLTIDRNASRSLKSIAPWDELVARKSETIVPIIESDQSDNSDELEDPEFTTTSLNQRRRKEKPKAGRTGGSEAKAPKLRPSGDVLNRIRWDPGLRSADFMIGYTDRFEGIQEIGLDLWIRESTDEEFVPQHRIMYFKHTTDDEIVWDRERRIDKIFNSGLGHGEEGKSSPH